MNRIWVLVGGLPGSGKKHLGSEISRHIGLFLDKDTVSRSFSEALLGLLQQSVDDRESDVYLEHVRPKEYETLMDISLENLRLGHSVVCAAPFLQEFFDSRWRSETELRAEIVDAKVHYVWIDSDEDSLHERLKKRGESRDRWKLANWTAWWNSVPKTPPEFDGLKVLDNRIRAARSTSKQLAELIGMLRG